MRRMVIFLFLFWFCTLKSFALQQASQVLTTGLYEVVEIEKIIVENIEYNRDESLLNMKIKETIPVDANNLTLKLSPLKIKLHTILHPLLLFLRYLKSWFIRTVCTIFLRTIFRLFLLLKRYPTLMIML